MPDGCCGVCESPHVLGTDTSLAPPMSLCMGCAAVRLETCISSLVAAAMKAYDDNPERLRLLRLAVWQLSVAAQPVLPEMPR
jgi:hypothetical protein